MNGRKFSPIVLILLVVAVLGAGTVVKGLIQKNQGEKNLAAPPKEYTWDPPTTGTPVEYYVVEVEVNGRDIITLGTATTESVMLPMQYGNKYRVRVAGVDAQGIQGPFSIWSEPLTPEIAPPDL